MEQFQKLQAEIQTLISDQKQKQPFSSEKWKTEKVYNRRPKKKKEQIYNTLSKWKTGKGLI